MARNTDPHPAPSLPEHGAVPHIPKGRTQPLQSPPPHLQPQKDEAPGKDSLPPETRFPITRHSPA